MSTPTRFHYQTPAEIIRNARATAGMMAVFGLFFFPIGCAALGVLLALTVNPAAGIAFGTLLWLTSLVGLWRLVRRRFDYELVVENGRARIGQGGRAVTLRCDQVELIVASAILAPGAAKILKAIQPETLGAIAESSKRQNAGFVQVQGQGRTRWIYLPPDQVSACASQLAIACPNAMYVDSQGVEHDPPSGRPATAALAGLARQSRNLALGLAAFAAVGALCGVLTLLSRMYDPPEDRAPAMAIEICFGAFIGCTAAAWGVFRKRARHLRQIRERQSGQRRAVAGRL